MFFSLELKTNCTYWFTNTHNSVFNFSLASLNKLISKEEEKIISDLTLYLISGSKVLSVCTLGKNSLQVKLNLYLTLSKEYKNQNIGFFILTNDGKKTKNGICLFGNYEYEETEEKYTPVKTSNKLPRYNLSTMSVERRIFFQEPEISNHNDNNTDLSLKEDGENKLKNNKFDKKKNKNSNDDNSSDNVYDDKNDKEENLVSLLNSKRKSLETTEEKNNKTNKVKTSPLDNSLNKEKGILLKPIKIKK